MEKIEARFKIVTPMFISGADQTKAELRVPSIKGALRFWWRALNYEEDPRVLLEKESEIFGSSNQDVGQSKVKIRLKNVDSSPVQIKRKWDVNDWKSYVGYGLSEDKPPHSGRFRQYLDIGGLFSLSLSLKDNSNDVIDSLKLFSLLGGLGSRSRKGWGSISVISSNTDWNPPNDRQEYKGQLSDLTLARDGIPDEAPAYSAISSEAVIRIGPSVTDPMAAFQDIGEKYKEHLKSIEPIQRAGFGLPRKNVRNDRRGSPLFIHIHQCGSESFWVCTFLRSQFDENNAEPPNGYGPVERFMNSIGGDLI